MSDDVPLPPGLSSTHNTAAADCHLKNFNEVVDAFRSAAECVSSTQRFQHKYTTLHAILLQWEHDDIGVDQEITRLSGVLQRSYGFQVQQWRIPLKNPILKLTRLITNWVEMYDNEHNLFLLYYAGHGKIDSSSQVIWANRRSTDQYYAELNWSGCEDILHESESDAIFLLDCCHAGASVSRPRKGFSETIAASGFEYIAPLPGPHSFTNALIRVLCDWSRIHTTFSMAALHAEIITYLKMMPSDQLAADGLTVANATSVMLGYSVEWRRTPIHYTRSSNNYATSIILAPQKQPEPGFLSLNQLPQSEVAMIPEGAATSREILSINLTEDIRADDADSCRKRLTSFPLPTHLITVEAVYNSFSTVVLISVPVKVWNVLPDIPGCQFVCYTRSRNLLDFRKSNRDSQTSSYTSHFEAEQQLDRPHILCQSPEALVDLKQRLKLQSPDQFEFLPSATSKDKREVSIANVENGDTIENNSCRNFNYYERPLNQVERPLHQHQRHIPVQPDISRQESLEDLSTASTIAGGIDPPWKGHKWLAGFMNQRPQLSIFRRFNALGIENLLNLQAQIGSLERRLRIIQAEHELSNNSTGPKYKALWETKYEAVSLEELSNRNREHLDLVMDLRQLMKEYPDSWTTENAIDLHHRNLKLKRPHGRLLSDLRKLMTTLYEGHDDKDAYERLGNPDDLFIFEDSSINQFTNLIVYSFHDIYTTYIQRIIHVWTGAYPKHSSASNF
ncbi:hypothetical protein BX600DRAFT_443120 [Xylariales sp. PMI_506]|nr:hypothetical protein BX600DRAFT_443120 [Xylariales sp. PMI_506]